MLPSPIRQFLGEEDVRTHKETAEIHARRRKITEAHSEVTIYKPKAEPPGETKSAHSWSSTSDLLTKENIKFCYLNYPDWSVVW